MAKGRHAADSAGSFYRDLAMMIVGIVLVGAAVFLLLFLLFREPAPEASPTTETTLGETTSSIEETTTVTDPETSTTTSSSTTSSTTTTVPVRAPSEVRVLVLNSIGLAGAAGRMTQALADAGYQTLQAGDYEPEQDPSRIWFREGFAPEANTLLEFLPGAEVEPLPDPDLPSGADVILVLGAGYEE